MDDRAATDDGDVNDPFETYAAQDFPQRKLNRCPISLVEVSCFNDLN